MNSPASGVPLKSRKAAEDLSLAHQKLSENRGPAARCAERLSALPCIGSYIKAFSLGRLPESRRRCEKIVGKPKQSHAKTQSRKANKGVLAFGSLRLGALAWWLFIFSQLRRLSTIRQHSHSATFHQITFRPCTAWKSGRRWW